MSLEILEWPYAAPKVVWGCLFLTEKVLKIHQMATVPAKGSPCWEKRGCPIVITQAVRIAMVNINYITAALIISKDQSVRIPLSYFGYITMTTVFISNELSCY